MSTKNVTLHDENGNVLLPATKTSRVTDANGTNLDTLLQHAGQVKSISVNGVTQTIDANGNVNIASADGVGIASVVQTTTSSEDGGTNVITVTKTDNTTSTFSVKNGSKGSTGAQGPQGERGLPGESGVTGDVSGFTVIQTIDPSATYGATDIAGAATVQATNAELTELAGEVALGAVYDVSVHNNNATFASLSVLLSDANLNTLIPIAVRKGGMGIKFVQSSDNKYAQYRLMADEWSTNPEDWAIAEEGVYVDNPEFVYVKTDRDGKILWAIRTDGGIYYGAGVPQQVKDYIEEKISSLSLDEYEDIVTFLGSLIEGDSLAALLNGKVDKEIGKSLINADFAEDVPTVLSIVDNPEWMDIIVDNGGKVLGGIKANGIFESKTGIKTTEIEVKDRIILSEQAKSRFTEDLCLSNSSDNNYYSYLDKKLILSQNRDYYFDDTWDNESSYVNTSYLDRKVASVPDGKHFLFLTDSHIDYDIDGEPVGMLQDAIPIVQYVRNRLGIKNVIFGGDAIGVQSTKYKAAKVLSVYANAMFEAFGNDFLWVMGNHDANSFNPIEDKLISDTETYNRTTKVMKGYGKAVFPTKLLNIIDTSNDILNAAGDALTQTEKDEFKAWVMQNYYYDDSEQKIRYIVLETGDVGSTMRDIFGGDPGDSDNSLLTITYFIIEALMNIPKDYDVVVLGHWIRTNISGFWRRVIYKLLAAYKNSTQTVLNCISTVSATRTNIDTIISKTFDNPQSITAIPVDLTTHKGTGRLFIMGGHIHRDKAVVIKYVNDSTNASVDAFALTTNTTPQHLTYTNGSILCIICDRCCVIERSEKGNPDSESYEEGTYSYPNDISYSVSGVQRLGTIKEVLFDVVTLTPDNRVVLTRFGAEGEVNDSPYVRDYVLPMAD